MTNSAGLVQKLWMRDDGLCYDDCVKDCLFL